CWFSIVFDSFGVITPRMQMQAEEFVQIRPGNPHVLYAANGSNMRF
ncbi:unnamed protein product, partial [Allacma fusca]